MSELTYAPVGATRTGDLPPGYRHLRHRVFLGTGEDLHRRTGEAILSFRMHRRAGTRITASAPVAEPGVHVTVGLGPLRVPCEIIWAERSPTRIGFGYGTLPGHQAAGEEAFLVERDTHDRVWFAVTAYSRPARALMRLGGPVPVLFQHLYARLLGRTLRRIGTVEP